MYDERLVSGGRQEIWTSYTVSYQTYPHIEGPKYLTKNLNVFHTVR
jgi:hypothetical protein